ncbi:hypothetical protein MYO4S_00013 [Serratia phage 4S]|nr:hypothetical protein MYO4S_00013 [Serratia phage 4S]
MSLVNRYFKLNQDKLVGFIDQTSENVSIMPALLMPFKVLSSASNTGTDSEHSAGIIECARASDQDLLSEAIDNGDYTYNFIFTECDLDLEYFEEVTHEEFLRARGEISKVEDLLKEYFETGGSLRTAAGTVISSMDKLNKVLVYRSKQTKREKELKELQERHALELAALEEKYKESNDD